MEEPDVNLTIEGRYLVSLVCVVLAGCGGGGAEVSESDAPTNESRRAAAVSTAENNPLCTAVRPFYWEIGNANGALASGSVGTRLNGNPWRGTDTMVIASASKWLYAAYAAQVKATLDPVSDIPFLNFTSGYSNFSNAACRADGTVAECLNGSRNATEAANATFHYNAGHLQTHAATNGLGNLDNDGLANELRRVLGPELGLSYGEPQLAGRALMTPSDYGAFLRKMLGDAPSLRLGRLLGSNPVCTRAGLACNAAAPAIVPEDWHYSLGHWVEDDPNGTPASNFAYSSGGALGFYPWINTSRTLYGVLAREDVSASGEGYQSGQCGRLIRLAWSEARAQ